ncbi:hypothetical protein [Campylobacter insulaenigrae]|uniref:hypothetical protein n=1 Tax=Campylobacter insulaenigrae TaxID=260714 RepID=UPI002152764A|nr:hypothetical protein [Campylobacter insulaenigrae]MCR6594853.1 hypothetical protein [Campylobacter insulaenigrae]
MQLYHEPLFREKTWHSDMRLQAKSIIDNNDFDSVIIGSSMLENTSVKEASDKLNSKFMNLSLAASTFHERFIILEYLIKHKKIKNIIYSLDGFSLVNGDKIRPNIKRFDFLYDDNIMNDFKLYLNKHFILYAIFFSHKKQCIGKQIDVYNLLQWEENQKTLGALILNSPNIKFSKNKVSYFGQSYIDNSKYLNHFLLKMMIENKEINFHLIIPTQPRIFYKLESYRNYFSQDDKYFLSLYKNIQFLIEQTKKYQNIKIYGFDDLDYADNIANYKDFVHYNVDMNSIHLDAIKYHKHILTNENIDKYFKIMEEKINKYNLEF